MKLNTKFDLFQIVYLVTDPDQSERMVTQLTIQPGAVLYQLASGVSHSDHWEQEISLEKNTLKALTS